MVRRERSKNRKESEMEKQGKSKEENKKKKIKKEGFYAIGELIRALVCFSLFHQVVVQVGSD